MALEPICFDNIKDLKVLADAHISRICRDVVDREYLQEEREVTISIKVTPRIGKTGVGSVCVSPHTSFSVKSKIPADKSTGQIGIIQDGVVLLEADNPDARQMDIEHSSEVFRDAAPDEAKSPPGNVHGFGR